MTDNIFARSWPEPSSYPLLNDNSALLDWALYELLPEAKEGVGAIEPEVLAIDDPATDEYEAEMNEHEWLTVAEVEGYSDAGRFDRFVADWQEMRNLLNETIQYLPVCTGIREDIEFMLEVTSVKP